MMKKGFTLAELLITVVILAVLASMALPNFERGAEKSRAAQAVAYLRTIRTAEQMYFAHNATYMSNGAIAGSRTINTVADIRTELGAEVSTQCGYGFSVTQTPTTFTATATRSVAVGGVTFVITLNEVGFWTENSPYLDATNVLNN